VSHDRAVLDAVPTRIVAIEDRLLRSYDGGWADLERERNADAARSAPKPEQQERRPPRPARARPEPAPARSELAVLEGRIESMETTVSQLEAKLAEDWTDMDALAAHRAARDELQELLARWEELFEETTAR